MRRRDAEASRTREQVPRDGWGSPDKAKSGIISEGAAAGTSDAVKLRRPSGAEARTTGLDVERNANYFRPKADVFTYRSYLVFFLSKGAKLCFLPPCISSMV
jgi:hypothetical protein